MSAAIFSGPASPAVSGSGRHTSPTLRGSTARITQSEARPITPAAASDYPPRPAHTSTPGFPPAVGSPTAVPALAKVSGGLGGRYVSAGQPTGTGQTSNR